MADKKISALPAATTPLAGTEVLPIVQGGTTDQVSVANLTSGRFVNMDSATVGSTSSAAYGSKLRVDGGIETFSSQYNIFSGSSTPYEFVLRSGGAGFDFYVSGASKRSVRFLSSGDVSLTDNLVVGTAGKGIDFSANGGDVLSQYDEGTWNVVWTNLSGTPSNTTGSYTRVGRMVFFTYAAGANTISGTGDVVKFSLPFTPGGYAAGSMISQTNVNPGSVLIDTSGVAYPNTFNATFMVFSGVFYI